MSRVAKKPIQLAKGVDLLRDGSSLTIKGPKGSLSTAAPAGVSVAAENGVIAISADSSDRTAMAGTLRALLANMVQGVSEGYARKLELVGVGYRASVAGRDLNLSLAFRIQSSSTLRMALLWRLRHRRKSWSRVRTPGSRRCSLV